MESDKTISFKADKMELNIHETLLLISDALEENGYNYKNQIVGYLLSGDPSYIPRYNNARNLIKSIDRDVLLEELLDYYMDNHE